MFWIQLLVRYSSHDYTMRGIALWSYILIFMPLEFFEIIHKTFILHSTYNCEFKQKPLKAFISPHCTQTNLTSWIRSSDMELSRSKREVLTLWSLTFLIYAINYSGHRIQQPITKLRILHFHKFRSQTIISVFLRKKLITNKQTRRVLLIQTGDKGLVWPKGWKFSIL